MPSLKDVKNKIASVQKTKQITKAMNMVASAKLRKAEARIEKFRPYAEKFYELLGDLAAGADSGVHPLLESRSEIHNVGIVLITSERGLCGAFNTNLIQTGLRLASQKKNEGKEVHFYCVGKKGTRAVRNANYTIQKSKVDCMDSLDFTVASEVGVEIINAFVQQEIDEVYLVYGEFINIARQQSKALQILPVSHEGSVEEGSSTQYMYEPSVEGLLSELLPRFVNVQVYRALLDTSASEHAARMTAMDNASNNCDDMISNLTLAYNKARQAAITTELLDIVGGAEALKG
jgi:F-type H+-transporting ATPase subunit gamma